MECRRGKMHHVIFDRMKWRCNCSKCRGKLSAAKKSEAKAPFTFVYILEFCLQQCTEPLEMYQHTSTDVAMETKQSCKQDPMIIVSESEQHQFRYMKLIVKWFS